MLCTWRTRSTGDEIRNIMVEGSKQKREPYILYLFCSVLERGNKAESNYENGHPILHKSFHRLQSYCF